MGSSGYGLIVMSNESIPIELVQPDFNWVDSLLQNLPFLLTVIIVVAAAVVTYRSNRKSVESQNRLAQQRRQDEHDNKISEFRHQWLQGVRETAAELSEVIYELQMYIVKRNIARENYRQAGQQGDVDNVEKFSENMSSYAEHLHDHRTKFYRLYSKLKLLFKKDDPSTVDLFKLLDLIKDSIYDFDTTELKDDQINNVIVSLQVVLKAEWEVTKAREWKST
ncbi:hypothetical protein [Rheinheimera salexigens]|uniref:Uncharacterized protein n=1 Tax=Rheinheimera salexigens TaxID=1628148 RepID=A0A1E7Q5X5_9GAMM|nr:hypothetical protein [Rheinheimera salexigens]OEY69582.1 hypothetical protein BI198_08430 [Rheinheimera salexigens]